MLMSGHSSGMGRAIAQALTTDRAIVPASSVTATGADGDARHVEAASTAIDFEVSDAEVSLNQSDACCTDPFVGRAAGSARSAPRPMHAEPRMQRTLHSEPAPLIDDEARSTLSPRLAPTWRRPIETNGSNRA